MQLYARDQEGQLIVAIRAQKQRDYYCRECGGLVHVRWGEQRRAHFFHLRPTTDCRSSGKSLKHLLTQIHLEQLIGSEHCQLEAPFPQIKRIADVYWPNERLIFEVQCSSISREELQSRNEDYESLGLSVIWIFHDSRFGQQRLTGAELELSHKPFYYTNIDIEGKGKIYDQYSVIKQGLRTHNLGHLPVDLSKPRSPQPVKKRVTGTLVRKRLGTYPFYFHGDLVDTLLGTAPNQRDYSRQVFAMESAKLHRHRSCHSTLWNHYIRRPYIAVLHALLENVSR